MTRTNRWLRSGIAGVLLTAAAIHVGAAPVPPVPDDPTRAVITGTVVDEAGKPVADAVVRTLWHGVGGKPSSTQTGADGRFRLILDHAASSNDIVLASDATEAHLGLYRVNSDAGKPTLDARIVLRPCRRLTARVADAGGKPVTGATVVVLDSSLHPLQRTRTGPDGVAEVGYPADAQVIQVIAAKAGVGLDYFENYRSKPYTDRGELPAEVRLILDGAQTAHVRVTDRAGKPIPGVMTLPWYIHKAGKAHDFNGTGSLFGDDLPRTGPDGAITIDWIPAELKAGVQIHCYSKEFHQPDVAFLPPGRRDTTLDIHLMRNAKISGRVTKPDGRPAPGVLVRAEGRGRTHNYGRVVARSASDGAYALLCPPEQSYMVAVIDDGWAAASHTGIVLTDGETREGLDFHLVTGTSIRGRVTTGTPPQPVADHTVTLIQQGAPIAKELGAGRQREDLPLWATTDADGRYRFHVGPGEYELFAQYGNNTRPEKITIQDEPLLTRDFEVTKPLQVTLSGVVRKLDGSAVAKASISGVVVPPNTGRFPDTIADDQGRFQTKRPPHRAVVYAADPAGTMATFTPIGGDETKTTLTLTPAARATGRLLGPDGKPRPKTQIRGMLYYQDGNWGATFFVRDTMTDAEGRFVLTGLAENGDYELKTQLDGIEYHDVTKFAVKGPAPIKLGDVKADEGGKWLVADKP